MTICSHWGVMTICSHWETTVSGDQSVNKTKLMGIKLTGNDLNNTLEVMILLRFSGSVNIAIKSRLY